MQYVVMFSGGVGSWAAARRVIDQHGPTAVTLLFTDTLIEDPDLYRFLDDAGRDLGVPVTRIADGRTPWQVFRDRRRLGTSHVANCSEELKQKPARAWVQAHCDPLDTVISVGIDWTEVHRLDGIQHGWSPWKVAAPLCDPPYRSKHELIADLEACGIEPPRLYRLGFPHNNCGGGCVRAGQAHFAHLLKTLPDVYAEWEHEEQGMRDFLDRDVSILKDRRGGMTQPLTLTDLRTMIESKPEQLDMFEWGGCACFA